MCADIRAVGQSADCPGADVVVAELLDAGGLGERLVPFLRHAKRHLLRAGGRVVPQRLRVRAALAELRLPALVGVDFAALEPQWLGARASAGEWVAMDLDGGMDWSPASDAQDVFTLDLTSPDAVLVNSLGERDIRFPLLPPQRAGSHGASRCNAIVWWFEAELGSKAPVLSSAPARFRPLGGIETHWVQAVAGIGPWSLEGGDVVAVGLRVRTDTVNLTWTQLGLERSGSPQCEPTSVPGRHPLIELHPAELASCEPSRHRADEARAALQHLRADVDTVGDLGRLQALQSAVLHICAQPGLFGLEATPEALAPLLKLFYS